MTLWLAQREESPQKERGGDVLGVAVFNLIDILADTTYVLFITKSCGETHVNFWQAFLDCDEPGFPQIVFFHDHGEQYTPCSLVKFQSL